MAKTSWLVFSDCCGRGSADMSQQAGISSHVLLSVLLTVYNLLFSRNHWPRVFGLPGRKVQGLRGLCHTEIGKPVPLPSHPSIWQLPESDQVGAGHLLSAGRDLGGEGGPGVLQGGQFGIQLLESTTGCLVLSELTKIHVGALRWSRPWLWLWLSHFRFQLRTRHPLTAPLQGPGPPLMLQPGRSYWPTVSGRGPGSGGWWGTAPPAGSDPQSAKPSHPDSLTPKQIAL